MKENRTKEEETRDQYTVVLEDIRSGFKAVGETLGSLVKKVDGIDTRLERVEVRLEKVEVKVGDIDNRLGKVEGKIGKMESSLEILKAEVALIRHNQITRDEFKLLESRVLRLEQKV